MSNRDPDPGGPPSPAPSSPTVPATAPGAESPLSRVDLETIVGALPILLFVLDERDVYTDFRQGGQSVPFVPPEVFLGRGLAEVLPDDAGQAIVEAVARVRATGQSGTVEYALPMPTGLQSFEATIVPLGGGRLAVLVVQVTERVHSRALLAIRLKQQSAVAQLGEHAIRAADLPSLFDVAVRLVAETLGVEFVKVLELEPDGRSLVLRAGCGWRAGLVGTVRVGAGEDSQAGYTIRSDGPVVVEHLAHESRFRGPALLIDHHVASGMSVVIQGHAGAYGVLGAHTATPRRFTSDDTLFLQAVANILAQAVQRDRILGQLRENEERFRLLIDRSADLIVVAAPDGVLRFVSASVEDILGFRAPELIGRSVFDLVHPEDREVAIRAFGDLAHAAGGVGRVTLRHRHRNGSFRILESSGINLSHVAAIGGIVVNSRDVTERHSLEDQLSRFQRLESVGRLAGGVAHDFNNILTVILGNAELLASTLPPGAREHDELGEITRTSLRARDLVQQLLAFARKQVLAPRVLDLNRAIRDLDRLLRRLLPEHVTLRVRLEEPIWPVLADPAQLEQVLINLAVNARDAMPDGGTLTIETANTTIDAADARLGTVDSGSYVLVTVSDSGVGMTPEVLAHVFEPFFTTKPYGAGTGLGLATTYGIVKQSGGHIVAESEAGAGSSFRIYLPRAAESAADVAEPAAPLVPRGTETLLLVEDDDAVRSVAQRVLERAGYRVLTAITPGGALAIEAEYGGPIGLLITDVVMAGMNGREVAAELCRRRPGLAVLYISGYTENAVQHHGVVEPGTWFLPKPFTGAMLAAKVREVLDAA